MKDTKQKIHKSVFIPTYRFMDINFSTGNATSQKLRICIFMTQRVSYTPPGTRSTPNFPPYPFIK